MTNASPLAALLFLCGAIPGRAASPAAEPAQARVLVVPYSGIISPVTAEFVAGAIDHARQGRFSAVVLELDTPGGLDTSMRLIVKSILNSEVPVIVYVSPAGARATSAGVFVTMAAHVAAMAPGTNIGAAHPVQLPVGLSGPSRDKEQKKDDVLEGKIVNDAAAYLRSIAHERGRNESWASEAVSRSTSIPASEAVRMGVVDLTAASLEELLARVDGRRVAGIAGPLRTAAAPVERYEMTRRQKALAALSDPNVAMILMSLGAAGLFIELYNPGLILPGVVGAVSLVLAFYSFQTLSANYAGIILLLIGMLLFLLEIKVASFGLLALGGVASVLLGVLMLFDSQSAWGVGVSWTVVLSALAGVLGVVALLSSLVYRAYRHKPETGVEGMLGTRGRAASLLSPRGRVAIHGEMWEAESLEGDIPEGAEVEVTGLDGLLLRVVRARK